MYLLLGMTIKVCLGKGFLKYEKQVVFLYSDFKFYRHDVRHRRTHDFKMFVFLVFREAYCRTRDEIGCDNKKSWQVMLSVCDANDSGFSANPHIHI